MAWQSTKTPENGMSKIKNASKMAPVELKKDTGLPDVCENLVALWRIQIFKTFFEQKADIGSNSISQNRCPEIDVIYVTVEKGYSDHVKYSDLEKVLLYLKHVNVTLLRKHHKLAFLFDQMVQKLTYVTKSAVCLLRNVSYVTLY